LAQNSIPEGSQAIKQFQLTPDVKSKKDWSWGESIAKTIYGSVTGNQSYFFLRNQRFRKNREIANGRMNMQVFMDRLNFDGKVNYANINWQAIKIVNTAIGRMVARFMGRKEKIQVSAVDLDAKKRKNQAALEAEFFMLNKEQLLAEQEATGVQMIPQDQFVPEDKDELDQWVAEFNQLPEEIKFSLAANNILSANGLYSTIKEKLIWDAASVGLIGTYTYMNEQGEVVSEWLRPENIIYSFSEFNDFRDTSWRGYIRSVKISALRQKYGVQAGGTLTEEKLFEIAQMCKEYQLIDRLTWLQEWNTSLFRPYDEWNIDTIEFEIKSFDEEAYTVTKTKEKNNTIVRRGLPEKIKENQSVVKSGEYNIYRGVFIMNPQIMLEWGVKKNMVRPQDPKELGNAEFSYSFYMYQNQDMRNVAIPEKVEEPIEQMILARLKIQQLVAKMKPSGSAVNIDALQAIDMGLSEPTSPLQIKKIWEQTGDLYYRGRDAEGNYLQTPITELANNAFQSQVEGLIRLYEFHYKVLQDELGENPNISNAISAPRVTTENAQNALVTAEQATEHIYDSYLYLMEDVAKKVACLCSDSVKYGAKTYKDILQEEDVDGRVFATKVEMMPQAQDIANLEGMLNNAIISDPEFILYIDPFKIKRMAKEDVRLAELYFRRAQKRYIKAKQQIAQQNSEMNIQGQIASAKEKANSDMMIKDAEATAKERQIVLQGAIELTKNGVQMKPEMNELLQQIIQKAAMSLYMDNKQQEQEIVAAEQEQMMAAQEQKQQMA
jgi:hypothetical protein